MSRRCGSSKPTPTPLNSLAMKPGKTRRKVIEGNADNTLRPTIRQEPIAYPQSGAGSRKNGVTAIQTTRQGLPAYRQRGGGVQKISHFRPAHEKPSQTPPQKKSQFRFPTQSQVNIEDNADAKSFWIPTPKTRQFRYLPTQEQN